MAGERGRRRLLLDELASTTKQRSLFNDKFVVRHRFQL
jgi:hypothetical protein